ncbi:MAG: SGNH/GDSL hydrolase family protein [Chitinophagaceae bacterium]|nr:MAG: SGNH/GDSL hydrolase family protein [Chitinophagaceae bacterium]
MKASLPIALLLFVLVAFTPRARTWTAIGDSITYLNEHPDETGNRITKGYMTRVAEAMPGLTYINQGHNGWSAVAIAREIERLGIVKSDIYTIFLGTNDWWQGLPLGSLADYKANTGAATTCGAFRIIINKIKSLNPKAKVILVTPLQRGDFVYIADALNNAYGSYRPKNGQELEAFADAIKQIGEYAHLQVVDLYHDSGINLRNVVKFKWLKDPSTGTYSKISYPDYIGKPFDAGKDEYPYPTEAIDYTYDGLHPSDKGYEVIAGKLIPLF